MNNWCFSKLLRVRKLESAIVLSIYTLGLIVASPGWTQEVENNRKKQERIDNNFHLEEIKPATAILKQKEIKTAQAITQVTGVQINPTVDGIEVILETATGNNLVPLILPQGKNLLIEILDATLALPDGEVFSAANPTEGITSITVEPLPDNIIRMTVTGETQVPNAEMIPSEQNLVLSISPDGEIFTQVDEEIIVTVTRSAEREQDVPRSITVIEREDIENQTGLNNNLQNILGKLVPGLGAPTQSISSFGQSLRGRNVSVLIDGVPQSTSRNVFRDFQTIDPAEIERIEVLRGPTALYGDGATGGVINIITRGAGEEKFITQGEIGVSGSLTNLSDSFGENLKWSIAGNEDSVDYRVSFGYAGTDGFFDANGDLIPPDPNAQGGFADTRTLNALGKIGIDISEEQRLQLTFNYFDDRQDTDFTSDPRVNLSEEPEQARAIEGLDLDNPQESENMVVNLQYSHENILGGSLDTQIYYRDYFTSFFPFDAREFDSLGNVIFQSKVDSEKWGGRVNLDTPILPEDRLNIIWGVDYFNENTEQPVNIFDEDRFDTTNGLVFEEIGTRTWTPPLDLNSFGVFAQLESTISDRFIVRGGLRYENAGVDVDDFTTLAGNNIEGGELDFDATLFNLGAVYAATDNISLFANFAQGFSLADIGLALRNADAGFTVETLDPEPQTVDSYEIGVKGNWNNVQFSLSGFYNESELGTTFTAPGTVLRAPEQIYGLEASIDIQPAENWLLGGTITLIEGEIDTDDDGDFEDLDSFRIPPLKITAYIENETLPGWQNRIQALFSGTRDPEGEGFGLQEVDSYWVFDLLSSIDTNAGKVQLGVENLFNNDYLPVVSQLQTTNSSRSAARGTTFSLRYLFEF